MPHGLRLVKSFRPYSPFLIAIFFALCAPIGFAQDSAPVPTSTAPTSVSPPESTPIQPPPLRTANDEQARLAKQQGQADTAILDWVLANSGPVKGDTRAGELRIAFTITPAEGWWDKTEAGKLAWHDAPDGNVHLRIFILDLADGRIVPALNVHATLTDSYGNQQTVPADFGWYPLINAYGGNVPLDTDGNYTLRVFIDPLPPHVSAPGRFEHPTIAEFSPVPIAPDSVARLPLATATAWAAEAALLKPSNTALSAAITALWEQSASGSEQASGDFFVGYALDYSGAQLAGSIKKIIEFSSKNDVRLDVLIRDSRSGRFIPGLKPEASLVASDGRSFGPGSLNMILDPWLNHYGQNARIPGKDSYKLRVHFELLGIRRWGHESERFAAPADVEFENVSLKTVLLKDGTPKNAAPKNAPSNSLPSKDVSRPEPEG